MASAPNNDSQTSIQETKEYSLGPEDIPHLPANRIGGVAEKEYNIQPAIDTRTNTNAPAYGDFRAYFQQRKHKLAEQAEAKAAKGPKYSLIFSGVIFHINGYTQPSHYELKSLLIERGGKFLHYLSKTQVTHIIASNLTMTKEKEFRNYKVVRPEWVLDSIGAGKQLLWQKYRVVGQNNNNLARLPVEAHTEISDLYNSDAAEAAMTTAAHGGQLMTAAPAAIFVVDRFGEGLNREWVRRNLATEPDFIQRYYANSRLHHLSIWKAELKDYVAQLRQKYNKVKPNSSVHNDKQRVIMHVDFDCFFVSVSLLSHPLLKNKPVAVCHSHKQLEDCNSDLESNPFCQKGDTSQIASCNYVARSFGVKNGMFMSQALQLCPTMVVVPYCFDAYKRISLSFYKIITRIADETQAVSVDEALLDVTQAVRQEAYQGNAEFLARHIRELVFEATQCTVSVGIGHNILLARIATSKAKPNGVFALDANSFCNMDVSISNLPGVGHAVEDSLMNNGIKNISGLRNTTLQHLQTICGERTALTLYNFSRGIDNRVLESDRLRQAFGADIGWGVRLSNQNEAEGFVNRLVHEVCKSMVAAGRTGSLVSLKIKKRQEGQGKPGKFLGHGICDSLSKSGSLSQMTNDPAKISSVCIKLLQQMALNPLDIRAVGIQIQKLNNSDNTGNVGEMLLAKSKLSSHGKDIGDRDRQRVSSPLLPSASQVDIDVLNSLPESIQSKIRAAYRHMGSNIGFSSNKSEQKSLSPGSAYSKPPPLPEKPIARKIPVKGKSKRGRPRKLAFTTSKGGADRPKQNIVAAFHKLQSLDMIMPSQMDSEVWENLPTNIRRELAREYVKSKPPIAKPVPLKDSENPANATVVADKKQKQIEILGQPPMLLGKHELSDVRALVRAWIDSVETNGPFKEDIAEFGDYIDSLIKKRDLFKARSILSFFKARAQQSHSNVWMAAVDLVLNQANNACMAMYNAKLHV
ncbi:deoxycytidyl transferase [Coemansia spiralis]|uniref:DNA repair protein REV1 n=2 Tax=Coemansia TaxID=4863 RepID=A0A9W8FXX8_9FUNG|nr:deoxycytidyl transferase [Coemansia umbellata]KAJ2623409.1 deoxycytidyl transferase [Coemansia sp. RSA 1358]KAJ2670386.1 deoxycytidyl transferase [Coemansia spiralis]